MQTTSLIVLMIAGWLSVAFSMLWGMLRVARRHAIDSVQAHATLTSQSAARPSAASLNKSVSLNKSKSAAPNWTSDTHAMLFGFAQQLRTHRTS